LANCPILRTVSGKTEAIKGLGENSTASEENEQSPGMSTVVTSVIVTVFVFTGGFGVGLGAAVTFGAFEQTEATQRSAASAERGMLAN
jgi:hypothetical protein